MMDEGLVVSEKGKEYSWNILFRTLFRRKKIFLEYSTTFMKFPDFLSHFFVLWIMCLKYLGEDDELIAIDPSNDASTRQIQKAILSYLTGQGCSPYDWCHPMPKTRKMSLLLHPDKNAETNLKSANKWFDLFTQVRTQVRNVHALIDKIESSENDWIRTYFKRGSNAELLSIRDNIERVHHDLVQACTRIGVCDHHIPQQPLVCSIYTDVMEREDIDKFLERQGLHHQPEEEEEQDIIIDIAPNCNLPPQAPLLLAFQPAPQFRSKKTSKAPKKKKETPNKKRKAPKKTSQKRKRRKKCEDHPYIKLFVVWLSEFRKKKTQNPLSPRTQMGYAQEFRKFVKGADICPTDRETIMSDDIFKGMKKRKDHSKLTNAVKKYRAFLEQLT